MLSGPAFAAPDSGQPVYRTGPASPWVEILAPDYAASAPAGNDERSTHYILADYQIDVRERGEEQFHHVAVRLVNDAGADDYSQVTFYADPVYQDLTIHWVRVHRAGRLTDRLAAAKVTVLPVETELQKRIYRGDYSVNLLIPDLRAGDVLDYAYTIESVSPAFPGHYAGEFSIAWSEPVLRQRIRLRHRPGEPISYRVHGSQAEPVVRMHDGRRELEFEWRDLPARAGESDVPDWYPYWAYVEFSDMADWRAVATPTAAMYRAVSTLGPRTRAEVEKLKAMPGTDSDRVLAALRMVQDGIRYASISIGAGSYRPHAPDVVLERNFGDCKDKSLLLANLLRAIGVEANVALVNTRRGESLPDALPTPNAFDHAIVRARIGDDVLWLDPTATQQRGSLANTGRANFANALVIDAATGALEPIPKAPADSSIRDVQLSIDLSAGIEEPAGIEVRSRYQGRAADLIRADMADRNVAQRTTDYLNYYAGYYPGIQSIAPIVVEDDPVENVVVVLERYRLERGFRSRADGLLVFELFPDELYGLADGTETPIRTSPLAQVYPARVSQTFEVKLPEPWSIRNARLEIDNPAFHYDSSAQYADAKLKLAYRFESRSDRVPTEQVPRYLADLKKMYDDLGYELTYDMHAGALKSGIAPYPLLAVVLGFIVGAWTAARWLMRYDPRPREPANAHTAPVGISGWLVIVALNVLVMCGAMAYLVYVLASYVSVDVWSGLPLVADEAIAPWAQHGVAVLLFLAFLLLPGIFATAVLFFRKRSSAPRLVIAMLWCGTLLGVLVEQWMNRLVPEASEPGLLAGAAYAGDAIPLVIWTFYLNVSQRVAATFRQRRPQAALAASAPPAGTPLVGQE